MKDQPERMAEQVNRYLDGPMLEPKRPPAPLAKDLPDGVCEDQDDFTLSGDFDEVIVDRCKNFHLDKLRARVITVRKSDGHLDDCTVSQGLIADESDLFVTGSELRGEVALQTTDSKLDVAGAILIGKRAALHADKKSKVVLSVTKVESPFVNAFMHEEVKRDGPYDL